MKNILITGGAGFIGSHLAKKLIERGGDVAIIDAFDGNPGLKKDRLEKFLNPKDYKFHNLLLSDTAKLTTVFRENKFDVICHLAAKTNLEPDSELYNKMNILGAIDIFEMARIFNVPKIVFASSSMVYGNSDKLPFSETDSTDYPLSLYAATKKTDEVLAYTYHHLYKIKMVGLRFFTTYGPWGRPDMSISRFTEQIIKHEPITVHNLGKIKRDYIYIDDMINGIISAIEKDLAFELINLGSGRAVELNQIVSLIENELNVKAVKKFIGMQAGDLEATWADISKAKNLLDFQPAVSLETGILKFINWYKEYNGLK
jgi:UDP-glucuronate 4-epimerase